MKGKRVHFHPVIDTRKLCFYSPPAGIARGLTNPAASVAATIAVKAAQRFSEPQAGIHETDHEP